MKTQNIKYKFIGTLLGAFLLGIPGHLFSQQSLEFASTSLNPTGSGSTLSPQVITFLANTNNPAGNNFIEFSPVTTVSFSFTNQQYTLPTTELPTGTGMCFGANANNGSSLAAPYSVYAPMNINSSPANGNFTSLDQGGTNGLGIDVANNMAVSLFTSCRPLYNSGAATTGRFYYGDLVINFNKTVINPVLHVVGLGGQFISGGNTLGFSTELELVNNNASLSKLSGTSELSVSATTILNNAINPSSVSGSGAASGSIKVTGNISSITFKVYLRGDGGAPNWTAVNAHSGDLWLMAVSMPAATSLPLPVKLSSFTATLNNSKTDLRWSTATEINMSHFVVERSLDGTRFSEAGIVAAFGNASTDAYYDFKDNLAGLSATVYWYRIRSVELDGSSSYSATRIIRFGSPDQPALSISTYPNPASREIQVTIPIAWQHKPVRYEIITLSGQPVSTVLIASSSQTETLPLNNLVPGFYMARVSCEGQMALKKIIRQ